MKVIVDNIPIEEADPITYFDIYEDQNIIILEFYNYRTEISDYQVAIGNKHYRIQDLFNELDYNIIIDYLNIFPVNNKNNFNVFNFNKKNNISSTIMNLLFSDEKHKRILALNILKNIIWKTYNQQQQ